ncbi:calcium-binding protein (plasmid) [Ensifer adhaerens]|uniref:calcium-binding protein n=1 Tax=Ensifer adhaerens TaxID=106592 RepID=UPI0023A96664|nr:calcium-binding protein [Ensifer adhaerens]WDZ81579.1 calcium-binding protein [Ensifer adhaerens]
MAKTVGNPGDDILYGTKEADRIWGLSGDDDIDAGGGDDLVDAGTGNDRLTSSSGYDRLDGGAGDDRISLISIGGAVTGGDGIDTLVVDLSMMSDQVMFGGANGHGIIGYQTPREQHLFFHDIERIELTTGSGDDLVQGSAFDDKISTGAGADFIGWSWPDPHSEASSAGDDVVDAGSGDDTIIDAHGVNHLFGGDGNDNITTTLSSIEIDGGAGQDALWLDEGGRSDDLTIDFVAGNASTGTIVRGIEQANIVTGSGNDTVIATNITSVTVETGDGDDHIEGGTSDDDIKAGAGADYLTGGGGNDWMWGLDDNDFVFGGDGDDTIGGDNGDDRLDGGAGNDLIKAGEGSDMAFGGDGRDVISSSGFSDGGKDVLDGGNGDDVIFDAFPYQAGLGDGSTLLGGGGNDEIHAYFSGTVDGGAGQDRLDLSLYTQGEVIDFDGTRGVTQTGLTFINVEDFSVTAGYQDDVLRGGDGNDVLEGLSGNDFLEGRAGNDTLRGGSGSNQLFGGEGDDILSGGDTTDVLSGGAGADTFVWVGQAGNTQGVDRIVDFDAEGGDVIEFTAHSYGMWDYDAFLDASNDTAEGIYVEFREGTGILIEGVTLADLSASDIIF